MSEIGLEVGKKYNIDYMIKELEKFPEIRLGHIYAMVLHEHLYHQGTKELEALSKRIKNIIASGGKEYEKIGRRFVATSDITVLSIEDPYTKYERYDKFYNEIYPIIIKGIEESKKDSIASPTEALMSEARKTGIVIEDEQEFLDGIGIFFKRKDIHASLISGGKYVLFEKGLAIVTVTETPKKYVQKEKVYAQKDFEKYQEYEEFYENLFKDVAEQLFIKQEIYANIADISKEIEKMNIDVGKLPEVLKGMEIYFALRQVNVRMTGRYAIFKNKG